MCPERHRHVCVCVRQALLTAWQVVSKTRTTQPAASASSSRCFLRPSPTLPTAARQSLQQDPRDSAAVALSAQGLAGSRRVVAGGSVQRLRPPQCISNQATHMSVPRGIYWRAAVPWWPAWHSTPGLAPCTTAGSQDRCSAQSAGKRPRLGPAPAFPHHHCPPTHTYTIPMYTIPMCTRPSAAHLNCARILFTTVSTPEGPLGDAQLEARAAGAEAHHCKEHNNQNVCKACWGAPGGIKAL